MIITIPALARARTTWTGQGHKSQPFDDAAAALDSATCHADVRNVLGRDPSFAVAVRAPQGPRNPSQSPIVRDILFRQIAMLSYALTEYPTHADVEILP